MVSRIALALDGSEAAERTIPVLKQLVPPESGARVDIIHVQERLVGWAGGPARVNEDELVARVKARAAELSKAGYKTHLHLEKTVGKPAHLIAERAEMCESELIITGTRGHGPVAGLLLGSVTTRLLVVAPCPVVVVPTSVTADADQEVVSTATATAGD